MSRKRKISKTTMKLGFESLEARLPFAADAFTIDLELGPAEESLLPSEHTIAGIDQVFEVAGAAAENGGHLFLYGTATNTHFEITGRLTHFDGTPGPPPVRLVQIPFTSSLLPTGGARFAGELASDGTLTLAWHEGGELFAQQFDTNLQPISSPISIATSVRPSDNLDLAVHIDEQGHIGIAFADLTTSIPKFEVYSGDLQQQLFSWESSSAVPGDDSFDFKLSSVEEQEFSLTWLSTSDSVSSEWTGYIVRFPTNGTPIESSWTFYGYDSPPEIALSSDGGILVAGERNQAGSTQVVFEVLDSSFQPEHSHALPPEYSFAHGNGLIVGTNDVVYLGLFEVTANGNHFLVQTFSESADAIGLPVRVNQANLAPELEGVLFPTTDGGVAAYWHGLALDGASSAILSRTYRPEFAELDISIASDDSTSALDDAYIEILGLTGSTGFDIGFRTSPTSWVIPASELSPDGEETVLAISPSSSFPLDLQVTLRKDGASGNQELLAAHNYIFGSPGADILDPVFPDGTIHGGAGFDTLQIPFPLSDLNAAQDGNDLWIYHGNESSLRIQSIEQFQVNNLDLTLPEFLSAIEQANPGSSPPTDLNSSNETDSVPPPNPIHHAGKPGASPKFGSNGGSPNGNPQNSQHYGEPSIGVASSSSHSNQQLNRLSAEGEGGQESSASRRSAERPTSVRERGPSRSSLEEEAESFGTVSAKGSAENPGQIDLGDILDASGRSAPSNQLLAAEAANQQVQVHKFTSPNTAQLAPSLSSTHRTQGVVVQRNNLSHVPAPSSYEPVHVPDVTTSIGTSTDPALFNTPEKTIENQNVYVASHPEPAFEQEAMFAGLDEVEETIEQELNQAEIIVGSAVVLATGISIANIAWTLRSSILLSNLMSSLPVFVAFDPLPILNQTGGGGLGTAPGDLRPDLSLAEIAQHGVLRTDANIQTQS